MSKYQGNFRYKRPSEGEYNLIANFISLGNYFIYFDGVELDNNSILSLHQSGKLFTDNFKLGSTLCREVDLTVLKSAVSEHPSEVLIKDVNNVVKFTLQVDSVDDTNIDFYDYILVDKMVNLNQVYNFQFLEVSDCQHVLNGICTDLLHCETPTIEYGGDIGLLYSTDATAREIVSWIAEINGCYARINPVGQLEFVRFANTNPFEVSVDSCADFEVGEYHKIDRVYVDLASASFGYPSTSEYNTVYLNPDNQLLSDSGNYTILDIVRHVHSVINGFEFYSVKTSRCAISQDSIAGDQLLFTYNNLSFPTIAQIDWKFNIEWYGGYSLEIETKAQQETRDIPSVENKLNYLKITVDRQNASITQQIAQTTENLTQQISEVQQTASGLSVRVSANEQDIENNSNRMTQYETTVNIDADGVRIAQGEEGTYTKFTDSEIEFYVQGVKNTTVKSDGLTSEEVMIGGADDMEKWHIHMANNGYTLMFLRR